MSYEPTQLTHQTQSESMEVRIRTNGSNQDRCQISFATWQWFILSQWTRCHCLRRDLQPSANHFHHTGDWMPELDLLLGCADVF